jgi:phospholipase/carboxylesterase
MTTTTELSHLHRLVPATAPGRPPILLLHGTGGDENDLLPLGQTIAPGAALLSPRGKVLEGGMPRFFRRLAEGVFDEQDVRRRANELADFVQDARDVYRLEAPIAVASRTAPTSPPRCCSFGPRSSPARSFFAPWCR